MDWASVLYLGFTFGLMVIFILIVWRTYQAKNKRRLEEPKHRMLDDD
ncbi:MAG: cbb3-type cytochrome c oxidase subunit 3 [Deltaproteobacteria bacterium]|jgi:cbb3-type cytochrome oxidase subunit 3|nr:cbb3-type cytochrome c oxidase subunit 3 [Deltaproteobacteria bacterium]